MVAEAEARVAQMSNRDARPGAAVRREDRGTRRARQWKSPTVPLEELRGRGRRRAGAVPCTAPRRRRCSAKVRTTPVSCWWASSRAIRKIWRAGRSSARRANCSTSALAEAGLDRATLYVTNAVKHFKYEPRGKRRIHKKPNAGEVAACRWWLEREIATGEAAARRRARRHGGRRARGTRRVGDARARTDGVRRSSRAS